MAEHAEVVVVGAGPAGAAAALVLARAGRRVVLLERGPFPGSKNMYGGVVYGRILDTLIPRWWEEAPVQRWITRRGTMIMTPTQSVSIDVHVPGWGAEPYNGATAYRPDFDAWLAGKAVEAGATLLTSTTATGLLFDDAGRVRGVRTDRPDGDLEAGVVIACDGVNSFLAKEAGLYHHADAGNFTLGAKEVLALPRHELEQRFNLRGREGVDYEILGATAGIPGGGFLYTNLDTVSVGVVVRLPELAASGRRPEELIANLKGHPSIAPLVEGGELKEYSAHVIPEGGRDMMPELVTDGMLVAGDAAAMCLAAGIWLEGVNFAIGAGAAAGAAADEALTVGDTSAAGLSGYRRRIESSFVLRDHTKLRHVPHLVLSDRVQRQYPHVVCDVAEGLFTVENPRPKRGVLSLVAGALRRHRVSPLAMAKDAWASARAVW